jgi:hypothetical protein
LFLYPSRKFEQKITSPAGLVIRRNSVATGEQGGYERVRTRLKRNDKMATAIATQKTIFAASIDDPATLPKPRSPAINATTKKTIAQCNRFPKFIINSQLQLLNFRLKMNAEKQTWFPSQTKFIALLGRQKGRTCEARPKIFMINF